MHINLFKHLQGINGPQKALHPRPHQPIQDTTATNPAAPQDEVTLSPEAMKAIQIEHRSHHHAAHARGHDNKINSLEKWVDKAVAKTEANGGKIPFGMEWKLEYLTNRIDKAINTDVGPNGITLNLTEGQQEKLIQINDKINGLLSPTAVEDNAEVPDANIPETGIGETSAVVVPDGETPSGAPSSSDDTVAPLEVTETTVPTVETSEEGTLLDILEEETTTEEPNLT